MKAQITFFFLLLVLLSACGKGLKKIDASTKERMDKSMEEVRASIPAEKRPEFVKALTALTTSQIEFSELLAGNSSAMEARIKNSLDGKTADEVIAAGNAIIAERTAREKKRSARAGGTGGKRSP